jgi:hypothetical protein
MISALLGAAAATAVTKSAACDPDLWLYRDRTVGLLKRYLRYSIEVGRLPFLLGREFFRTRVTSYHAGTFEDAVIFVHDVERALEKLDGFEKKLIARIVLQEYTHAEAAILLGCWRRTVGRRFPEALDRLCEIFLEGGLLIHFPAAKLTAGDTCQGPKPHAIPVSHSM